MEQTKKTLKQFFETGDKPTQQQYADLIDSYVDAKQPEGEPNRRFVIDETGKVTVAPAQEIPEYDISNLEGNTLVLLKNGKIVKKINLSSYIDDTNLARLVSGKVDKNGMATFTRDDDSTFTVDFSSIVGGNVQQIQANWQQTDKTQPDFIKNKPNLNLTGGFPPNFYEEGQWNPDFGSFGFSYNTTSKIGKYIKIGNLVHIAISLKGITTPENTVTDLTNTFYISLPFARDLTLQPTSNFKINHFILGANSTQIPSNNLSAHVGNIGVGTHVVFNYTITGTQNITRLGKLTINNGQINITGTYFTDTKKPNG
ncbi:hypothetical protein T190115A13A_50140 [Tenacibaculum sp. 190524A02b]|uniref:Uncharacterized protein n=1 Tax=Tenacibaculum vairaonense TaxID=3137860 RepID=A0ABM9PQ42_9FLAO